MKRFVLSVITAIAVLAPTLVLAQDSAPGAVPEVKVGVVDIKSALLEGFVKYVLPVAFTGLTVLLGLLFASLRKKFEADAGNSKLAGVAARATAVIDSVTHDLEATLKPKFEEATQDGVLTPAEIAQLRDVALARVKELLGKEGLADLAGVLGVQGGAIDKVVSGLIEKSVAKIGGGEAAPAGP